MGKEREDQRSIYFEFCEDITFNSILELSLLLSYEINHQ